MLASETTSESGASVEGADGKSIPSDTPKKSCMEAGAGLATGALAVGIGEGSVQPRTTSLPADGFGYNPRASVFAGIFPEEEADPELATVPDGSYPTLGPLPSFGSAATTTTSAAAAVGFATATAVASSVEGSSSTKRFDYVRQQTYQGPSTAPLAYPSAAPSYEYSGTPSAAM